MKYIKIKSPIAVKKPGFSLKPVGKKPTLGSGGRFKALSSSLKKKGATNPETLAAWIGRKKYGVKKFSQIAAKGRKK